MSDSGKGQEDPLLVPTLPPEVASASAGMPAPVLPTGDGFPVAHWERYEFIEPLGRGGMGDVYKARDRRLGRVVALKFIRGADPSQVMRLLQEARAQARIDHPHVCKVYEVGEVGAKAYIAMQLVSGRRLDEAAVDMSLPEKVQVLKQTAEAVHEAHRLGVIHRDLKPSNILAGRGEDGRWHPVVMDFGLAYESDQGHGLTETGALLGTPAYMAPEQARGDVRSIDRRSDVYSLGATLYELLAGVAPFTGATPVGTLAKVLHEEPPPLRTRVPLLASELETIVLKCLSKEPHLRYASARALAEDLGRYLDGEPILGQRPSRMYRLKRWARKHRALVALSALSLASILLLSAFGVRSWLEARWTRAQSAERARRAEQLGQQVKEMEWFLRAAFTLPLHDTRPEQQRVHERMARLAAQRHELGEAGEGLVHYALGRGHLALFELEQANAELTKAREAGIDSPELHYARGRVLGELYHQSMEDARRGGGKEWVAERQRELEKQYLEPALQALERSRGLELESPRYLEGLIAFYRREFDAAARLAHQAATEAPWMYEARKLAGDVSYTRALGLLERGEYEASRTGFQEAEALFTQAAEVGRSDARIHEALAQVGLQQAELDRRQGKSPRASLERALAEGSKALQAAPLRASAYTQRAYVLMQWYRLMRFQGGGLDPKPILAEWLATAARAVELDPRDVYAYDTLGNAHFMRGLQEAREGRSPEPAYEEAISWLTKALQLQPRYPWGLNDLALVHRWKGTWRQEHGQDPRASFTESVRYFREAVRVDPNYLFAYSNLVDLYTQLADDSVARGLNPEEEVRQAHEAGQRALALDGRYYVALTQVAAAELPHAEYLLATGGDPGPALARMFQHLERSAAINATFGSTWVFQAMGHHLAAVHARREDRDPRAALEAGRKALEEAYRHDSGCVNCRMVSARLGLEEAAWARRQGRAVLPLLQQSLAEARRAVELFPYPGSQLELARVYWRLAEAQPRGPALQSVEAGLAQVEQALRLDASLAHAHALRGALLLEKARVERTTASGRLERVRQARGALARALELNPLLRWMYEEPLHEAELLLSQADRSAPGR
ncbi:serine/threonine-protein kinase [Myxococcus sp. RHSTA-1-4]|uniref:protein kinase domain-containing protein n=1 Tax=Myxococcus sp. RHSTA-1-4 TaxID=2874601 RepID=UPI001CBC0232|nr:serine/threonine-protein kinase [Myxococcus sp. RHSTA-1-4]MBZ4420672.1 protein kinase [Myxococcus sp. RHSTA-1-4]